MTRRGFRPESEEAAVPLVLTMLRGERVALRVDRWEANHNAASVSRGPITFALRIDDSKPARPVLMMATGMATIEEMAAAAKALGHSYLAITDHSKRVAMAGGMPAARMGDMAVCTGPPDTVMNGCPTVASTSVVRSS